MLVSELVDDRNVSLEQLALFTDRRLHEEVETKITDATLRNDMLGAVHLRVMGANKSMTNSLGFSSLAPITNTPYLEMFVTFRSPTICITG